MSESKKKKPKKQPVKKSETKVPAHAPDVPVRSDRFDFSPEVLKQIETMAGLGLTQKQLCAILGISVDVFQLRSKEMPEIDAAFWRGKAVAISNVAQTAYKMATSGKDAVMTKFFLKAKANWKEGDRHVVVGEDGAAPIKLESRPDFKDLMKDPEAAAALKVLASKAMKPNEPK